MYIRIATKMSVASKNNLKNVSGTSNEPAINVIGIDVAKNGSIRLSRPWPFFQKCIMPINVTTKFMVREVVGIT